MASLGFWLPRSGLADENLIRNGDLTAGTGEMPDDWRTKSQREVIPSDTFSWKHQPGSSGELGLTNHKPSITDWSQTVKLPPGWYHLTGDMKITGSLGDLATIGVHLRRHEFAFPSLDASSGGGRWTTGGLYFRVGDDLQSVQIVCQLEGRGSASFRHIRLTPISGTPPAGAGQFDLRDIRERPKSFHGADPKAFNPPQGRPWSIVALILSLAGITLWGWVALAPPAPEEKAGTASGRLRRVHIPHAEPSRGERSD